LAAVVLNDLTISPQSELFYFLPLLTMVVLTVCGLAVLLTALVRKSWGQALVFAAVWPAIALLPLFEVGDRIWGSISLAKHRVAYETILAEAGTLPQNGEWNGHEFWFERESPLQVYFQRAGFLMDHGGFVFDASDRLPLTDPNSGIGGAGGDQICQRLEARWYRCWFS
jgi:hypothetical protein